MSTLYMVFFFEWTATTLCSERMDYYRSRFIDSFQANQLQHGGQSSTAHVYNYIMKLTYNTLHFVGSVTTYPYTSHSSYG